MTRPARRLSSRCTYGLAERAAFGYDSPFRMKRPPDAAPSPLSSICRRCRHFCACLVALLALAVAMGVLEGITRWRMPHRLNLLAERMVLPKLLGNVQQAAAFRTPGVLPLYGSSELNDAVDNRAEEFFLAHAEGLRVFPIGRPGNTSLLILEKLAGAGSAVRGRKVAIFLSPNWFLRREINVAQLQDNVTATQLCAWIFGDSLSPAFKRRFARRLLEHPGAVENEPMLTLCLSCLARDTAIDRARFALLTPIGLVRDFLLERLDFWEALREMRLMRPLPKPTVAQRWRRPPAPLDDAHWQHLADKAEVFDRRRSPGSAYAALPPAPDDPAPRPGIPRRRDAEFASRLDASDEWRDLALLIDGLKELGADAVFVSQPFNGIYQDLEGETPEMRQRYYDRLAATVKPSGYPLLDFSSHEHDKFFFNDENHPSAKAWIFYDHCLDAFYHGSLSAQRSTRKRLPEGAGSSIITE